MNAFDPFSESFWISVGAAVLCGGVVGLERQVRGKPAGVRTSILICLGTAVFIRLGASLAGPEADPTRVLGQLVTGVGFLGAGVMFSREGTVVGVTTASVVWVLAATGAAIGFGLYASAIALAFISNSGMKTEVAAERSGCLTSQEGEKICQTEDSGR